MASPALRRSGRSRVPVKKLLDEVQVPDVDDHASESREDPPEVEEATHFSAPSSESEEEADPESEAEPDLDSDVEVVPKPTPKSKAVKRTATGIVKPTKKAPQPQSLGLRNRGLPTIPKWTRREDIITTLFGADARDSTLLVSVLNRWMDDPVAPSRSNLQATVAEGDLDKPDTEGFRDWYHAKGGADVFQAAQAAERISSEDGKAYHPQHLETHKVVMGPHWHQTLLSLDYGTPIHLSEAWKPARKTTSSEGHPPERRGWMLNLGAKIHGLAWAPNVVGSIQYLAVSLMKDDLSSDRPRSAFEPSSSYAAGIQFWAFSATDTNEIDDDTQPTLVHFLCADWGMCLKMEWCPGFVASDPTQPGTSHVGLLASIWTDGYVRVLDIQVPTNGKPDSIHALYKGAAFTSKPPQSICTSVCWVSDRDLVVGCANGQVAVWNVAASALAPKPQADTSLPEPYMVQQMHHGYVLDVAACRPRLAQMVVSSGTDGYMRLTDLRNAAFDTTTASRSRIYPQTVAYCGLLGAVLAPDGIDGLSLVHVRRFFSRIAIRTCEAQVSALAASHVHPFSLVGLADGSIVLQNLLTRLLESRNTPPSTELRWFQHEWMPDAGVGSVDWYRKQAADDDSAEQSEAVKEEADSPLRPGTSRILEGFKPVTRFVRRNDGKDKAGRKGGGDGGKYETIYEEPSAITSIAWHPNARYGGWVVAGMGSGLVRIEDLAV